MTSVSFIPDFVHRENGDGTFDSFCRGCFVTVATARLETELKSKERDHICDFWDLMRYQESLGVVAAAKSHALPDFGIPVAVRHSAKQPAD